MQVLAALCFLVLAHLSPLRGEVVISFESNAKCLDFFYKGMVPMWDVANPKTPNTACLCQRLNNRYHFATLYNKEHRIPVYSAYLLQTGGRGREDNWYIEPQLVDRSWTKDMEVEQNLAINHTGDFGKWQALDEDYKESIYDRGHLNPNGHHSGDSRNATFTLTNVVPQNRTLNQKAWNDYEKDLQKNVLKNCSQAYVLVGAIPSKNKLINNRVNVPDYIWNAYCCLDNNDQPIRSGGAIANNTVNRVVRHTLSELKTLLKEYTKSKVLVLFRNKCEAKRSIIRYLGVC